MRAQIFIIGLILIALVFLMINSYYVHIAADEIIELKIIELVQQRKIWEQNYWWNFNWTKRTVVNISEPLNQYIQINAGIDSGNCYKEVRVIKNGIEVPSNVSSIYPPCDVIFNSSEGGIFEIYWSNPFVNPPTYRNTVPSSGATPTYNILKFKESSPAGKLCNISLPFVLFECTNIAHDQNSTYHILIKSDKILANLTI